MKVGIIGYGKMGAIRHQATKAVGCFDVVKIYDPYSSASIPKGLLATSLDEIWEDASISAVFICTVNKLNKPTTLAALEHGKHVFCEKPPAFTARDVEDIIQVEKRSGKVLMYGFNHRHHGATRQMKEIVDNGHYGRILWMRGRYGKSVDEDYFKTWRADPELAGGGILLDQGIHMLDLFLHLGDGFDDVHAFVSNLYWNLPDVEDNVFAIMRNSKTGQCASLHSTMTQWRHLFSFEVFMEKGYMVLNGLKTSSQAYGVERLVIAKNRSKAPAAVWEDEEAFEYEADLSWEEEVRLFRDSIQNPEYKRTSDSKAALEVMKLIDSIYQHDRYAATNLYTKLNLAE